MIRILVILMSLTSTVFASCGSLQPFNIGGNQYCAKISDRNKTVIFNSVTHKNVKEISFYLAADPNKTIVGKQLTKDNGHITEYQEGHFNQFIFKHKLYN